MGLDVGAYKRWNKVKVTYHRPKFNKQIQLSKKEIENLYKYFHNTSKDFLDYILWFSGTNKTDDFSMNDLEYYVKKGQELRAFLLETLTEEDLKTYSVLLEELKSYGLLKIFKDCGFVLVTFNSLEDYEREIWEFDDDVDVHYPNGEILEAFSKVKEKLGVNLYPYIICTETMEEIDDRKVNHNIEEAILSAKKAIELNNENIILHYRSTPIFDKVQGKTTFQQRAVYLNDILKECIRVWELGAKLEFS